VASWDLDFRLLSKNDNNSRLKLFSNNYIQIGRIKITSIAKKSLLKLRKTNFYYPCRKNITADLKQMPQHPPATVGIPQFIAYF
jgi:hypothetical protein